MRKIINQGSLFILYSALIYVVLVCVWGLFFPSLLKPNINYRVGSYGHMNSRLKEVKKIKDVDVLFLGSSHAYRGFDNRIFSRSGYRTYNLGSSAQTPIQSRLLLQRYLDSLNPKYIIYEVFPGTFISDGVESSIDIISNDINDLESLRMSLKVNHIKVYNTLIYGMFRDVFGMNDSFIEPNVRDLDTFVSGGYVARKIETYRNSSHPKRTWDFNIHQKSSFDEIVKITKEKGIELILVRAPISNALYNSFLDNDSINSYFKGKSSFYDFNTILKLNDSLHFYDFDHLNQNGVTIFNNMLLKRIELD